MNGFPSFIASVGVRVTRGRFPGSITLKGLSRASVTKLCARWLMPMPVLPAITEGIHFFKSHKKESTAILASILKTQDRNALEEMYLLYARDLMPEVPYSSIRGVQNALELLALRNPKAKSKDPMDTVDDSLVKEMEGEGFITYLRKTYSSGQQK